MLSSTVIDTIKSISSNSHKSEWEYRELTVKQIKTLATYIPLHELTRLDRGEASLFIDCTFLLRSAKKPINDFQVLRVLDSMCKEDDK